MSDEKHTIGIDLADEATYGLITRIFWARIAPQAQAGGIDPEDLLGDLWVRLLRSNEGRSPFDSRKSSLSQYAYLSSLSLLRNKIDSRKRAERRGWICGGEEDVATSSDASVEAQAEGAEVWLGSVARAVEAGTPAAVAALQGLSDSVEALLLARDLAPVQGAGRGRKRRAGRKRLRPKLRKTKTKETTVSLPTVLGVAELMELGTRLS